MRGSNLPLSHSPTLRAERRMPTEGIMPTLGRRLEGGPIMEWPKGGGATVTGTDPLFAVKTDKAAMDAPAPASGVLTKIIAQAGDTVAVRKAIAIIGDAGEAAA